MKIHDREKNCSQCNRNSLLEQGVNVNTPANGRLQRKHFFKVLDLHSAHVLHHGGCVVAPVSGENIPRKPPVLGEPRFAQRLHCANLR